MRQLPVAASTAGVAVVIVAYRSSQDLALGLEGVLRDPEVARVVVVDNSADEDTRIVCEKAGRHAQGRLLYRASNNIGFGRACNVGAALCAEPFLLFLNPDVVLHRPLAPLKEPLLDGRAAITAGRLVTPVHGSNTKTLSNMRELSSPWTELNRSLVGARRSSGTGRHVRGGGWREVPQLDGAFLLMSREVWSELAGFDERFELYYEDVDLCRRSAALGGCMVDTTEVYGQHNAGASYSRERSAGFCALRISRMRYLRKHYGASGTACAAVVAAIEWLSRSLTLRPEGARTRWKGLQAQARELVRPGTVWVLPGSAP